MPYPSSKNIYNPLSPSTHRLIEMNQNITALRAGPPSSGPSGRPTKLTRRSLVGGAKRRSQTKITRRSLVGGTKCRSPPRASAALGAAQLRRFASPSLGLASLDLFCASYLWYSAFLRVGFASALFKNAYFSN